MAKENISTNIKGHTRHGHWHKLSGILLAVVGFFWLAKKVGWIPVAAGGLSFSGLYLPLCLVCGSPLASIGYKPVIKNGTLKQIAANNKEQCRAFIRFESPAH